MTELTNAEKCKLCNGSGLNYGAHTGKDHPRYKTVDCECKKGARDAVQGHTNKANT